MKSVHLFTYLLLCVALVSQLSAAPPDNGDIDDPPSSGTLKVNSPGSLLDATVSAPYTSHTFKAKNGKQPYAWTFDGLPAGLSVSASGDSFMGTPEAGTEGNHTITAEVRDADNDTAERILTLVVLEAFTPLALLTSEVPVAFEGVPYESEPLQAAGGVPPYTWTRSSSVPWALVTQLPNDDWVVSGTPFNAFGLPLPTSFTLTLTVEDSSYHHKPQRLG